MSARPNEQPPASRPVVDASGGDFYQPTYAPVRVTVATEVDANGLPASLPEGSGFLDPRCLRFHDLAKELPNVGPDRRLAIQVLVDYDASYQDPREPDPAAGVPEDAPFGQPERFTASNRTTRWADSASRVALPTSLVRLIGSEDQRDAVALAYRGPASPEVSPLDTFDESDLPEGVHIDEAGELDPTGANSGGAVLSQPRVLIDPGLSFFGAAAVQLAKQIAREGGTKGDIRGALSAQARGVEPPPRETQEREPPPPPPPTKPAGSVTPANHPLGYVWDETSESIGLLGTLVQAGACAPFYFLGREGNQIRRLAIRSDGHFAIDEQHTGALALKGGDAADIPEHVDGTPVKGWLVHDSTLANQDSEVGLETGKFRPVVYIRAEDIKPPPPPNPPPYVEPPRVQPPPPGSPPPEEQGTGPSSTGPDPGDTGISPWIGLLPDPAGGPRNVVASGAPGPASSSTTGTTGHPGVTAQGGWLVVGGQQDADGTVQGGQAIRVPDGYQPVEGTTASVPAPALGSPEAPDLATWAAWITYLLGSQQVMALGLLGGGSYVDASLGAISTGPTSQGSVVGEHGTAPAGTTRTAGPALEVTSTLTAEDGGEWVATDGSGVATITRGPSTGSVRDSRPMVLIDDQAATGDLIATTGGEFGVSADGKTTVGGLEVAVAPGNTGTAIAVGVRDPVRGGIAGAPAVAITSGGVTTTQEQDEPPEEAPEEGHVTTYGWHGGTATVGSAGTTTVTGGGTGSTTGIGIGSPVAGGIGVNGTGLGYLSGLGLAILGLTDGDGGFLTTGPYGSVQMGEGGTILGGNVSIPAGDLTIAGEGAKLTVDVIDPYAVIFEHVASKPTEIAGTSAPGLWVKTNGVGTGKHQLRFFDGTDDAAVGSGGLRPWREFPSPGSWNPGDLHFCWGRLGMGDVGGNVALTPTSGTESDGTNYLAYAQYSYAVDDGSLTIDWLVQVPENFTGWQTDAIQVRHRHSSYTGTSGSYDVDLTVYNPTTGASLATATTHVVTAAEGSYSWITVAASSLGSTFTAGQLLHFRFSVTANPASGVGSSNVIRVADVQVNWT